jgi:hypothetical protein
MSKKTAGNIKKLHSENKRCVGPACNNDSSYPKIITVKPKFLMKIRTLDKLSNIFYTLNLIY